MIKEYPNGRLYTEKDLKAMTIAPDCLPMQVMFSSDPESGIEGNWVNGIMTIGTIICLCCGGTVEVDELRGLFIFDNWANVNEYLGMDGLPDEVQEFFPEEE